LGGLFTQEDPIGLAGGMNLYGFAGGDPINFSDPFGLNPLCLPCRLALAGVRGGIVIGSAGGLPGAIVGGIAGGVTGLAIGTAAGILFNEAADDSDQAEEAQDERTAGEIISADKKGSINRRFPGEMVDKTLAEIDAIARGSDKAAARAAKTARKLLTDRRFDKGNR
jgi:hypothetical protein